MSTVSTVLLSVDDVMADNSVIGATKGITNPTVVTKAEMVCNGIFYKQHVFNVVVITCTQNDGQQSHHPT